MILGAGFSHISGLPLTKDLLIGPLPATRGPKDKQRMSSVQGAFLDWASTNPGAGTEQWLREMYDLRDDPMMLMSQGTEWGDIMQYILRRLTPLPRGGHGAYYYGVSRYSAHPIHEQFWSQISVAADHFGIITTNYDILAERALHRQTTNGSKPLFYYGGLPYGLHVRKMTDLAAAPGLKHEDFPLGDEIPIYKLHGSINWAFEPHSFSMKVHDDVRAAFRQTGGGVPAIVPPVEEKELDQDFSAIWAASRKELSRADHWVVCGYSLPPYDVALCDHFHTAARQGPPKRVSILDPYSASLADRWKLANTCHVEALDGLPEGLTQLVL